MQDDDQGLVLDDGSDSELSLDDLSYEGTPPQPAPSTPPAEEALEGDDVPESYRNKSARELLDILRNKEEMIGRQANEIGTLREQTGTLRGVVDQAIAMRAGVTPAPSATEEEAITADSLLNDPEGAIARGVTKALNPVMDKLTQQERRERQSDFLSRHPTALQDVEDDSFVEYVKKSQYRANLAQKAFADMSNIDFDAAEELWLGYEEARSAPSDTDTPAGSSPAKPEPDPAPELISGGGNGSADPGTDKTIYSAAKLIKMQQERPDDYYEDSFYEKIVKAYSEGRVR